MENESRENSRKIEEYIKIISLNKLKFMTSLPKEDECDIQLSDDE
jgi:hypothetical protein